MMGMKKSLLLLVVSIVVCYSYAQEAVDLGLSVKWATMNIGASNIYDVGEYFAWGEAPGIENIVELEKIRKYRNAINNALSKMEDY